MGTQKERVAIYHAMPLCKKCNREVSRIKKASENAGAGMLVMFSFWKRIKYGLRLLRMPVVVIDNKPFSTLGAFGEETLAAELKRGKRSPDLKEGA